MEKIKIEQEAEQEEEDEENLEEDKSLAGLSTNIVSKLFKVILNTNNYALGTGRN